MDTNDKKDPTDKEDEGERISGGYRFYRYDNGNLYPMYILSPKNEEQEQEQEQGAGAESKMKVEIISADQVVDDYDDELQRALSYSVESPRSDSSQAGAEKSRFGYDVDAMEADVAKTGSEFRKSWDDDTNMAVSDSDDEYGEIQKALFWSMTSNSDGGYREPDWKQKGVLRSPELVPYPWNWFDESLMFNPPQRFNEASTSSYVPLSVCVVCADHQPPENMYNLSKSCKHTFCKFCIYNFLLGMVKVNIHELACPDAGCEHVLDADMIFRASPEELKRRWWDAFCETRSLAEPEYVQCPFFQCEKKFMGDKRGFKIKACPNCNIVFCIECKVRFHMGSTCEQYQARLEAQRVERECEEGRRQLRELLKHARSVTYYRVASEGGEGDEEDDEAEDEAEE